MCAYRYENELFISLHVYECEHICVRVFACACVRLFHRLTYKSVTQCVNTIEKLLGMHMVEEAAWNDSKLYTHGDTWRYINNLIVPDFLFETFLVCYEHIMVRRIYSLTPSCHSLSCSLFTFGLAWSLSLCFDIVLSCVHQPWYASVCVYVHVWLSVLYLLHPRHHIHPWHSMECNNTKWFRVSSCVSETTS